MELLFWFSFLFIFYTYVGYPCLLFIWERLAGRKVNKAYIEPKVSIVIAAHNEEKHIGKKIENCLGLNYPKGMVEVIVVSDGSEDRTNQIAGGFQTEAVRVLHYKERKGKAYALNLGVSQAKGEILFFTDARQILEKECLRELAANFNDSDVGAVSGELVLLQEGRPDSVEGVGLYWRYEKWMRKKESRINSVLGATGSVYACRKHLVKPIPPETILDDVLIPFQGILKGYRSIFEPKAVAFDHVAADVQKELKRKVRTLAGNYQALLLEPRLLHPLKNPVFFQLMSHKMARLLVPFAMLVLLVSNFFIASGVYWVCFVVQLTFYVLALTSKWGPDNLLGRMMKVSNVIMMMNYAALASGLKFLRDPRNIDWEKSS